MGRRLLKIVGIPVVVIALLAAVVMVAHATADSDLGYTVLMLIAGESPRAAPGQVSPAAELMGPSCDSGGSCSVGGGSCSMSAKDPDHSCDSDGSCRTEAGHKESAEAARESGAEETVPAG
jgi:hypothetical protein